MWSLSLGPESGLRLRVWVRVWGQSLESGQSLGPESGVWVRVWGQSLESGSELGSKFEPEFGVESESRHPKPNPEMGLGQSLEPGFGSGSWTRIWVRVQGECGSEFGSR